MLFARIRNGKLSEARGGKIVNDSIVISRKNIFIIFFILTGYMIYSPMTSNFHTNPDGIAIGLVYKPSSEGGDLGRIGIRAVDVLFGRIISPNLMLIVSLCLLGITVGLLIKIFHIELLIDMILVGVLMLLMPTTSSIFTYYYCMVPYMLACLLSVYACYITISKNQKKCFFIVGGGAVAVSLMLYQAYLSVTIVVALLYLIYMLLIKPAKEVLRMAFRLCLMGISGVGLYLGLLKITRIQISSNRGFDKMGHINIVRLPVLIRNAYSAFVDYFLGNGLLNNSWMYRDFFNLVVLILCMGMLVYLFIVKRVYRQIGKMILFWGLVLLLPIGFEVMVVVAPDVNTYGSTGILLVPAMGLVYMAAIFFCTLVKNTFTIKNAFIAKTIKYVHLIVIIPIIWNLILFTAAFENVMWLNYQSTYTLCEKMSAHIDRLMDEYTNGPKIMIGGNPELGNYPCMYEELRAIVKGTLAVKGLVWQGGWLSNVCYQGIFKNYYNINYQIPTVDEYNTIMESMDYKLMEVFPNNNSVIYIDDIIVIKLSE